MSDNPSAVECGDRSDRELAATHRAWDVVSRCRPRRRCFETVYRWARQAEVEYLGGDIGRQKVKLLHRKLAESCLRKLANIICCRVVVLIQADQDVAILRANDAGGGVHGVIRAVGQAEVVEDIIRLPCPESCGGWDGFDLVG